MGRIGARQLARLCHNVGTALHAGVDVRRVWETESLRGSTRQRSKMAEVRDRIAEGDSLGAALTATNGYFPPLVCEMVEVGERTGRLEQVFSRLGEHYDQVLKLRRTFLAGIAWPLLELTLALLVIGLFIWILGMVWSGEGDPPMTFFGLWGTRGLVIYLGILALLVATVGLAVVAVRQGLVNLAPLLERLMYLPGIGTALRTMAISRLTWSLSMASDSDLDPQKIIELAVRTTQNSYYTRHIETMKPVVARGGQMHEAFQRTGAYPDDFLDALETGEIAGRISESMAVLAEQYEERAKHSFRILAIVAGAAVFLLFVALMIFLIFSMALQYVNLLNSF